MQEARTLHNRAPIDCRAAKALSHPLRVAILVELNKAPMSPSEYIAFHGGTVSNVSYHFRVLEKLGCLRLVGTTPRRGAVEHHYQATTKALAHESWAELPTSIRGGFSAATLRIFMEEAAAAMAAGTLDARDDRHITWQSVKLDAEGWSQIMDKLMSAYEAIGEEQVAAAERMSKTGEDPILTTIALVGFESPALKRQNSDPDSRS